LASCPSVAVMVPARDAEPFLDRAVRSVFATGHAPLKVIIVDDGSLDGTIGVAEGLCREFHPHCRLLRHPDGANRGVSASRNLAIAATDSEWVAFLDADDFYHPNRFMALQRHAEQGRGRDL